MNRFPEFEELGRAVAGIACFFHTLGRLAYFFAMVVWLTFDNARQRRLLEYYRRRLTS